jgi:hypothetical protein
MLRQSPSAQLTPLQQTILDVVRRHPGRFSRSGLAKMLVGAKSWQDKDFPEYGCLAQYFRKDVGYQVEIFLQQGRLQLDYQNRLVPEPASSGEQMVKSL